MRVVQKTKSYRGHSSIPNNFGIIHICSIFMLSKFTTNSIIKYPSYTAAKTFSVSVTLSDFLSPKLLHTKNVLYRKILDTTLLRLLLNLNKILCLHCIKYNIHERAIYV